MNLFITILVIVLAWKITNAFIVAHDKKGGAEEKGRS